MPSHELSTAALWAIGIMSVFVGGFAAMLGIGGGIVLVPLLISAFGIDAIHARSASLAAVCVTSLAASVVYLREGQTNIVEAGYLQLPTAVGAITGALIGKRLDETLIRFLFAAMVVLSAIRMFKRPAPKPDGTEPQKRWMAAIIACLAGGIISSLLGVGGGIIFVPVLALLMHLPQRAGSATSTYLIGLTTAASALLYFRAGQMDVALAVPCAAGILVGAQIGARLSGKVDGLRLRRAFALLMFANAALLFRSVYRAWVA
jgi:uncharacterized membrane protein YfcA